MNAEATVFLYFQKMDNSQAMYRGRFSLTGLREYSVFDDRLEYQKGNSINSECSDLMKSRQAIKV